MNAVMYGGGNIGRGFIGMLFSASGYEVKIVDVVDTVVETLNREHQYPVRILSNEGHRDIEVTNVSAVDGKNPDAVAEAIACADIMATAVGARILKYIVPNIVAGLRRRWEMGKAPLNIIICENLMDANKVLEAMLKEQLTGEEKTLFDETVGLVEASIGRMVPVQTEEMKDGNPLRVCVESYGFLPVDKAAFKGKIPQITGMVPFEPFDFYIKRKLYIHNMGHATCAYLGGLLGLEYIYQSIDVPDIRIIVQSAMLESAKALSQKYGVPLDGIVCHIEDLLYRFTNAALRDTCARVGGDPARKLSNQDRLIGSAMLVEKTGEIPVYIAVGAAAGLYRFASESNIEQSRANGEALLLQTSGLEENSYLAEMILHIYQMIVDGCGVAELRRYADQQKAKHRADII
jgi:mannitol-1-phosphate 5-dehydrogenase